MPRHDKSIQNPSIKKPSSTTYHHLIPTPPTPNSSGAARLQNSDLQQSFNGSSNGEALCFDWRSKSLRGRFQSFHQQRKKSSDQTTSPLTLKKTTFHFQACKSLGSFGLDLSELSMTA